MSIIVEDGTGLSNAESLASVQYFKDYHSARGNTTASSMLDAAIEAALRKASDYFLQIYRARWKGDRTTTTQALDWPRVGVIVDVYTVIESDDIPKDIKNAFCELAYKSVSGDLLQDVSSHVIRQKVDTLEVEYQPNTRQTKRYSAVESLLQPYLKSGGTNSIELFRA